MALADVLRHLDAGGTALDTREPSDFAAGHLRGAIHVGLEGRFAEWAGDVLAPESSIVLVGDPATARESAVRLARIGFDNVVGHLGDPNELFVGRPDLVEASSRITIEQLAELVGLEPALQLVDVRNPGETADGTVPGARMLPLAVLVDSLGTLDRDAPVVVNCAGGHRSLIAASVLRHAGFTDVSDLLGGYGAWASAGLATSMGESMPGLTVQVTPIAADGLLGSGAVLLDVREVEEWDAGHAPDAILIPMGQVEARVDELATAARTVVVCRSGGRSNAITQLLTARGIDAVNLAGGMHAWERDGLPVVTSDGRAGRVI